MDKTKQSFVDFEHINFKIEKNKSLKPESMKTYHYHDSYEIYYLLSGERYYFIKDKIYHIKKGTIVFINANDLHCTRNIASSGFERILIDFTEDFISPAIQSADSDLLKCFKNDIPIIELDKEERYYIENLLNSMQKEYIEKEENYLSFLQSTLIQLLVFINRHNFTIKNMQNDINPTHKQISKIIGYINEHFSDDITLESISEKFYISPCYFSRTFKKVTDLSFIEYLNNVRIKEAKRLLIESNMNITEISEKTGFKSSTHFGRVFKKITKMSALKFKQLHNKKQDLA